VPDAHLRGQGGQPFQIGLLHRAMHQMGAW
jgi:hypothetical protein